MDGNPFACFAFEKRPVPEVKSEEHLDEPPKKKSVGGTSSSSSPETSKAASHDPLCLWGGVDHFAEGSKKRPFAPSAAKELMSANEKLEEYALIQGYRLVKHASVDEFNLFLLTLHGSTGRYWALVACLLSVQCLDSVALKVVKQLMAITEGPQSVLDLGEERLSEILRTLNYYRGKVKYVLASTRAILADFRGEVPSGHKDLLKLPGVGDKIANLMRSVAFGDTDAGIVVDTHVHRIAHVLSWVPPVAARAGDFFRKHNGKTFDTPEGTRIKLEEWVPSEHRSEFALAVIGFGQCSRKSGWETDFVGHVISLHGHASREYEVAMTIVRKISGQAIGHSEVTLDTTNVGVQRQDEKAGKMALHGGIVQFDVADVATSLVESQELKTAVNLERPPSCCVGSVQTQRDDQNHYEGNASGASPPSFQSLCHAPTISQHSSDEEVVISQSQRQGKFSKLSLKKRKFLPSEASS